MEEWLRKDIFQAPLVLILSREECSLCDTVVAMARALQPELQFAMDIHQIDDDPALRARYGLQVPVVLVDGVEIAWGQVTAELLRDAVKKARRRRPISRILSRLGLRQRR